MDDIFELTRLFYFYFYSESEYWSAWLFRNQGRILISFLDFPVFRPKPVWDRVLGPFCTMLTLITQLWLRVTQVMRGTYTAYITQFWAGHKYNAVPGSFQRWVAYSVKARYCTLRESSQKCQRTCTNSSRRARGIHSGAHGQSHDGLKD